MNAAIAYPLMVLDGGIAYASRVGFMPSMEALACQLGTYTCGATWTMPHVMFTPTDLSPASSPAVLAMRAQDNGVLINDYSCEPNIPNCTWTVAQSGMIFNDKYSSALNASGGAGSGLLAPEFWCFANDPNCTWKLSSNHIGTDNGNELIQYQRSGANNTLTLPPPCNGPYCFLASTNFSMTRAAD